MSFHVVFYGIRLNPFKLRKKKVKKSEMIDFTAPDKIRMRDIWKNINYTEKVFFLCAFVLSGLIWIINTLSGFVG